MTLIKEPQLSTSPTPNATLDLITCPQTIFSSGRPEKISHKSRSQNRKKYLVKEIYFPHIYYTQSAKSAVNVYVQ
jgi:hypothetical protein